MKTEQEKGSVMKRLTDLETATARLQSHEDTNIASAASTLCEEILALRLKAETGEVVTDEDVSALESRFDQLKARTNGH